MKIENSTEDFDKGFDNGLDNIERGNYESFLSSQVNLEWLLSNKEQITSDLVETKNELQLTKSNKLEVFKQQQVLKSQFEEQSYLIAQMENTIESKKQKIDKILNEKKENSTFYPFLAGILYLAAGITFILGDLIISHEIVAYALNIRNTYEAWAFACGLAGVSILLKPAYERLVEQPYLKEYGPKTKKIYGYFQIALVVISIGTLSILGWFRYEAYKTDKLKEGINRQIKSLQLESTPLVQTGQTFENPALTMKIEQKLKEYDLLNQKLVNSPWALLSFVLSGVLFAIAGAICLGISFPILHVYWKRWFQQNPSNFFDKRAIKKHTKVLNQAKKPWFVAKSALEFEENKLSLFSDSVVLTDKIARLEMELSAINEKIKLAIESARVSSYSEGYESGYNNRNQMSNDEFEAYRTKNVENQQANKLEGNDKAIRSYRTNGLRPHQALRKAISEGFNEN
jgi:hypothetical protein